MSDHIKLSLNPNFKADVIKAAEEKLGIKIATEKQALEALTRGQRLSNAVLAHLSSKGLIEVTDVTNMDSPPGERELLFTFITQRGKKVLEG
jgi:hypothetical protein